MPLTRAWGAEGFDEDGWGEAESKPEAGARVQRGLSPKTTPCLVKVVGSAYPSCPHTALSGPFQETLVETITFKGRRILSHIVSSTFH